MVDMAHIAGLVAAGVHPSPVPHADFVTTTTHKTLRGPRGGMVMCKEPFAKALDRRIFPGIQGGPLMHVIAAKAVAFREALQPDFKAYQQQIVENAQALAEALKSARAAARLGRHRQPPDARRPAAEEAHRQGRRGRARQGGDHGEQEHDPVRPARSRSSPRGVRVGTPAVTTRGMKEPQMAEIGKLIGDALDHASDDAALARIHGQVKELAKGFPLYASRLGK